MTLFPLRIRSVVSRVSVLPFMFFACFFSDPSSMVTPCEQSLSKTHQRASKRGYAEIVSSLFKSPKPKFLGESLQSNRFRQLAHHIFDKAKVKIEPSVRKSIWRLGVRSRVDLGLELSLRKGLRTLNKD